jgi:hypothetical protein
VGHTIAYYARAVQCPTCLMGKGKQCRAASDGPTSTHAARIRAYLETKLRPPGPSIDKDPHAHVVPEPTPNTRTIVED